MLRYKRLSNYYLFTILNVYPLLGGLALQIATIQVIQLSIVLTITATAGLLFDSLA